MKFAIPLFFTFVTTLLAAQAELPIQPDDDFAPGLFFVALIFVCAVFILIGVGIFVAAVIAAATTIMVALGITSTAVIVALVRRRFSSGLRALHYQFFAVAAIPAGIGVLWLGTWLVHSEMHPRFIVIFGSLAGVSSGLALAFSFDLLAKWIYRRLLAPPDTRNITNG